MYVTNLSNVLFFSEKNKVFKKKNRTFSLKEQELFKIWPVVFSHNGIYMPNRLIFTSDLSAIPQTPCPSAFRLKDMHCEMFQPENILQEKRFPKNRRKISSAETFQPPAEGFLSPILQPECPRVGRLRAGWSLWRIFHGIHYRANRMTIFHLKK